MGRWLRTPPTRGSVSVVRKWIPPDAGCGRKGPRRKVAKGSCMGSVRYIGSKARLTDELMDFAGRPKGRGIDLFCGTGAVSAAAADAGWEVLSNDNLNCAVALTAAAPDAKFEALGGYASAIRHLNGLDGVTGFITEQYSPASLERCGVDLAWLALAHDVADTHAADRTDHPRQFYCLPR